MPAGFGFGTATWVVVASMVGVGVLTTSGFTVKAVGSNQLMLWLWILGGLVALCGALTLAELGAAFPKSGGDYIFLYESYGPMVAFLSGWASFLIGFGAPIAISAAASAKYFLSPCQTSTDPALALLQQKALATGSILAFALIHCLGRGASAKVQGVATIVKVGVLIVLAFGGIFHESGHISNLLDAPKLSTNVIIAALFSQVYISYAYTGWNAAGYIAEEVAEPSKNLPRAILLGTLGVTVLYVALNCFYALALPAPELVGREDVAEIARLAAEKAFGARVANPLSMAVGLMLLSTLSAYILTGPRILFAMARRRQFPSFAGKLSKRAQTPVVATVVQVCWSLVLLWLSDFENLMVYASVGLALFSMLSVSSIYILRWKAPDIPRPFRTPGYPLTPAFFLVFTTLLTGAAFYTRVEASSYALGAMLIGIPVYLAFHRSPS